MDFKPLYSLSIALALAGNINAALPGVRYKTEIVKINLENYEFRGMYASGVFFPQTNTIKINYFMPDCNDSTVIKWCRSANNDKPFVMRHEMEHARKAYLTTNIKDYSPMTRGRISIIKEIVSMSAEIITALDMHATTGQMPKTGRKHIYNADKRVSQYITQNNLSWPVNCNDPQIANIIIECATDAFLNLNKMGAYTTTIRRDVEGNHPQYPYTPNKYCALYNKLAFLPESNMWGPMWDFESDSGPVNLWTAISYKQRQDFLDRIDNAIIEITGIKLNLFEKNR